MNFKIKIGGPGGNRTPDALLRTEALYPLSYEANRTANLPVACIGDISLRILACTKHILLPLRLKNETSIGSKGETRPVSAEVQDRLTKYLSIRVHPMGLERITALTRLLNVPSGGTADFFHVAGTNGKGSTTTTIQSILTQSGKKTGAAFSPFVFDIRERVQINGKLIPREEFHEGLALIKSFRAELLEAGYGVVSMFEAMTALGFWFWQKENCDAVAIEVGLGGRLDATNIVDPAVSVIVSIGFDHVEILGNSLTQIAEEKAGIIKPGKPVVVGQVPAQASKAIRDIARKNQSEVYEFGKEWLIASDPNKAEFELNLCGEIMLLPKPMRLKGPIQTHNAALATVACLVGDSDLRSRKDRLSIISKGLQTAYQPGRFQVFNKRNRTWILDGAHNEQASAELVRSFQSLYPGLKAELIHGMFDKRDPMDTVPILAQVCDRAQFVTINWQGARPAEELNNLCCHLFSQSQAAHSVPEAVEHSEGDIVLVTGSYYLLSEVARALELPVFD